MNIQARLKTAAVLSFFGALSADKLVASLCFISLEPASSLVRRTGTSSYRASWEPMLSRVI